MSNTTQMSATIGVGGEGRGKKNITKKKNNADRHTSQTRNSISEKKVKTDRPTDDTVAYIVACSRLKIDAYALSHFTVLAGSWASGISSRSVTA